MDQIEISPVTRIEGQLKVTIKLDEKGNVSKTMASTEEFRGFEKFLEGRLVSRVPIVATRICGVCPVPHHLASVKAIENGLGLTVPETAEKLRELMLMGEILGDHTLQVFVLSGPDYLLQDQPLEKRDIVALNKKLPNAVKDVIFIREVGQRVIETLGVQAVHPMTVTPGGITKRLSEQDRAKLLSEASEAKKKVLSLYDAAVAPLILDYVEENMELGNIDSSYMAMSHEGLINFYTGKISILDNRGRLSAEFEPSEYGDYIAEEGVQYTYTKGVRLQTKSKEDDLVRTGPLARVNVAKAAGGESADEILKALRKKFGSPINGTLQYNLARYVCLVYAAERLETLLSDESITKGEVRTEAKMKAGEGAGAVEAARGTLIHHYKWNDKGYVTFANIITPTETNSRGIEASVMSAATRNISKGDVNEKGLWNDVGLVVRAYDPCISCSTHLEKDLIVRVENSDGQVVSSIGGD